MGTVSRQAAVLRDFTGEAHQSPRNPPASSISGEPGSTGELDRFRRRFPIVLDTFCLITNGRHVTGT